MPIALDTSTDGGNVTSTSLTFAHTVSGSNRILWVTVFITNATDVVTGVTYAGTAMTRVDALSAGSGTEFIYNYYLIAPATGANNVVISTSSSVPIYGQAASYTGAKQSGVPDANTTNSGASPLTTSVTTVADNCWLVGVFRTSVTAAAAGTGTTFRVNVGSGSLGLMDSNGAKTPPGSYSLQSTNTGGTMWHCVASFAPVASSTTNKRAANIAMLKVG